MEKHLFNKVCPQCKHPYETYSRGQRFCSKECCQKHSKKLRGQRTQYQRDQAYESIQSKAYALAHAVAQLVYPKPADEDPNDPYELHHMDENVLNNDPSNLLWVPVSIHNKLHSHLKEVNMNSYLKILKAKPELTEEGKQEYIDAVLNDTFDKESCRTITLTTQFKVVNNKRGMKYTLC